MNQDQITGAILRILMTVVISVAIVGILKLFGNHLPWWYTFILAFCVNLTIRMYENSSK